MSTQIKRYVIVDADEQHACTTSDRYHCLAERHTTPDLPVSVDMAKCLGGCVCDCHMDTRGIEVEHEAWTNLFGGK